jgi:hypothetical protein
MTEDIWTYIQNGVAHLRFNKPESRKSLTMITIYHVRSV